MVKYGQFIISITHMKFAKFMSGSAGRSLRAIVGALLVWWGVTMGTTVGYAVAIFGLVAIASGVFNFCLIAPLLSAPFWGKDIK